MTMLISKSTIFKAMNKIFGKSNTRIITTALLKISMKLPNLRKQYKN